MDPEERKRIEEGRNAWEAETLRPALSRTPERRRSFETSWGEDVERVYTPAEAADPAAARKKLVDEYKAKFAHPYIAAELGYFDDVIEPSQTRARLIRGLELLQNKRQSVPPKKHGNIPL